MWKSRKTGNAFAILLYYIKKGDFLLSFLQVLDLTVETKPHSFNQLLEKVSAVIFVNIQVFHWV